MHPRALSLIQALALQPHPEGGYYREVFCSPHRVGTLAAPGQRPALTAIYFLLTAADHSRWHRLRFDECWSHLEGDPVMLHSFRADTHEHVQMRLGSLQAEAQPLHTVPAGLWQAAQPLGQYALVSAIVGPGFEFADLTFLSDEPESERILRTELPGLVHLI